MECNHNYRDKYIKFTNSNNINIDKYIISEFDIFIKSYYRDFIDAYKYSLFIEDLYNKTKYTYRSVNYHNLLGYVLTHLLKSSYNTSNNRFVDGIDVNTPGINRQTFEITLDKNYFNNNQQNNLLLLL
jgi:hypothetical protein